MKNLRLEKIREALNDLNSEQKLAVLQKLSYLNSLSFEWDPKKSNSNRDKHGICFEVAANIIRHPKTIRFSIGSHENELKLEEIRERHSRQMTAFQEALNDEPDLGDFISTIGPLADPVRDKWIGLYDDKVWTVITVLRGEAISSVKQRIISARRARESEIDAFRRRNVESECPLRKFLSDLQALLGSSS